MRQEKYKLSNRTKVFQIPNPYYSAQIQNNFDRTISTITQTPKPFDPDMDLTKMKAPKGQENLKDALGNFVYQQPKESLESKLQPEALSKKELREAKKQAKKNTPKPKELKRITLG